MSLVLHLSPVPMLVPVFVLMLVPAPVFRVDMPLNVLCKLDGGV